MKILISGTSGFVGSSLVSFFERKNDEVYKLVRTRADLSSQEIVWDPLQRVINPEMLEGLDAVVHLAGENIIGRWSDDKKKKIRESRVGGTKTLCKAICQLQRPPQVLISASAIGFYGNRGEEELTEQSAKGKGYLADVCAEWEEATRLAVIKGVRVVNLRIGMVLSPNGGALKKMLPIFKFCLGGPIGTGLQYVSWVAIQDLLRIIDFCIQQNDMAGPVNAVSPHPETNGEFTRTLAEVIHRPAFFKVPEFMVKAIFGEMGEETLLTSEKVIPQKLMEKGFEYNYPFLEHAIKHMLS